MRLGSTRRDATPLSQNEGTFEWIGGSRNGEVTM
jgi:hypothetical protein